MKTEIANRWADALESGEHTQAFGALTRSEDGSKRTTHCCLGVLCELAIADGVDVPKRLIPAHGRLSGYLALYGSAGEHGYLPSEAQEWAGMRTSAGDFADDGRSLSRLNDERVPFSEIANTIREHAEAL